MPLIGEFHSKYWRTRANAPIPPGVSAGWMYPGVQSVVTAYTVTFWPPFYPLWVRVRPIWEQLRWYGQLARRLWQWRSPTSQDALELWIGRLETFTPEQWAALERVVALLRGPWWTEATVAVRDCATTPAFHDPAQWVEYGRLLKGNIGQAQNVFRHLKAVAQLRAITDEPGPISNPDAHLVVELAYHARAAMEQRQKQIVEHEKQIVEHEKTFVMH